MAYGQVELETQPQNVVYEEVGLKTTDGKGGGKTVDTQQSQGDQGHYYL